MLQCKENFLLFILCGLTMCYAELTTKMEKSIAVKEVIQKVHNLTSGLLLNGTADQKEEILKGIKSKLLRSSKALGDKADKYVQLIMKGIQIMALNNTSKPPTLKVNEVSNFLRSRNKTKPIKIIKKFDPVKKMASKMFVLAQNQSRRAKIDSLEKFVERIKQKVLDTADEKYALHGNKKQEIKTYTELLSHGLERMIEEIAQKKRRMLVEFVNTKTSRNQDDENLEREYKQLELRSNFLGKSDIGKIKLETKLEKPTEAPRHEIGFTTPFSCDNVLTQTCTDIKSLDVHVCSDNGLTIPLNKLCDGIADCSDGSDERQCVNEATKLLYRATDIMSRIEIYLLQKCFISEDNTLIKKQNALLNDVLQRQIGFLNKYKDKDLNNNEFGDVYVLKQTLNEVAIVIKTLSLALGSSLCNRLIKKDETMAFKYTPESMENLDEFPSQFIMSPKNCKCRGSFCADLTCPEECKRVCWYKYNLGKWSCQAVDEYTTIPLDMVCDGKIDCYDESDEKDCKSGIGPAKFEANDIFQKVLKMVQIKRISKEYAAIKSKLLTLQKFIQQLQMEATRSKVDVINLKDARDECFAFLSSIYEDILKEGSRGVRLENKNFFLLTVNEQLMIALKLSHTGNNKIITPDGCYCRNGKCVLKKCTKVCIQACSVEPKLTKYTCKGTVDNNVSVAIDKICNGKIDCPHKDDEASCSNDVCRKHHLVLLHHSISDVGENIRGTPLGEALRSWKTEAISKLKTPDSSRPNRTTIREVINNILHDLVMTYGTLKEAGHHGHAFNDFLRVSQLVIEAVKSCGQ